MTTVPTDECASDYTTAAPNSRIGDFTLVYFAA